MTPRSSKLTLEDNAMALLEVKDLSVYYGVIQALKGISFEVETAGLTRLSLPVCKMEMFSSFPQCAQGRG